MAAAFTRHIIHRVCDSRLPGVVPPCASLFEWAGRPRRELAAFSLVVSRVRYSLFWLGAGPVRASCSPPGVSPASHISTRFPRRRLRRKNRSPSNSDISGRRIGGSRMRPNALSFMPDLGVMGLKQDHSLFNKTDSRKPNLTDKLISCTVYSCSLRKAEKSRLKTWLWR